MEKLDKAASLPQAVLSREMDGTYWKVIRSHDDREMQLRYDYEITLCGLLRLLHALSRKRWLIFVSYFQEWKWKWQKIITSVCEPIKQQPKNLGKHAFRVKAFSSTANTRHAYLSWKWLLLLKPVTDLICPGQGRAKDRHISCSC